MGGYWLQEFTRVLFGYAFLMFLWPMVVFGSLMKGRTKTFRFGFCVTVQPVLLAAFVLASGLLGILSEKTFDIVVYGAFFACAVIRLALYGKRIGFFEEQGHSVWRGFDRYTLRRWKTGIRKTFLAAWNRYKGHRIEYLALSVMLVYGVVYFSYGAFCDHSYGWGDMYTHAANIDGLINGQVFSDGIYPLGMHSIIFGIHALFGIEVYSVMLFTAGIHIVVFLLSAYILLKELFRSRYAVLLAVLLFLTVDVAGDIGIYAMSRLQYTIPMEFGLYTVFLCPAFLLRYLKSPEKKEAAHLWNEELLGFLLAVAASVSIHFYAVIMAFFLCAAVALSNMKKVFSMSRLIPLMSVVLAGLALAGIFFLVGILRGVEMESSLGWALSVMQGQASEFDPGMKIVETQKALASQWRAAGIAGKITLFWRCGFWELYRGARSVCTATIALLAAAAWAAAARRGSRRDGAAHAGENSFFWSAADDYGKLGVFFLLYMVLYTLSVLRIFAPVSGPRLCSVMQLLAVAVLMIPFDILFSYFRLERKAVAGYLPAAFLSSCVWIVALEFLTGTYHGYLYYELTQYNAAVETTESIIKTLPAYSYTIVSPTDALYQTSQYGFHEELLSFVENVYTKKSYTLPTEHIYLYVEKKPIRYAQSHFFTGPAWLAADKYAESYSLFDMPVSRCPEITVEEMPEEAAPEELDYTSFDTYKDARGRAVLESLAYQWSQEFLALYPNIMTVYYEDEDFICCEIRQDEQAKLNLASGD